MAGIKANNIRLRDEDDAWVSLADGDVQDIINSSSSTSIGDMLNNIVANEEAIAAQTDTKNTAGATTTSTQTLHLIGTVTTGENPQTYTTGISASVTPNITLSNASNKITVSGPVTLDSSGNGISINNSNGTATPGTQLNIPIGTGTLGDAAKANITNSVTTGGQDLPNSAAVSAAIQAATVSISNTIPTAATSPASTVTAGSATVGTGTAYARANHQHNITVATGDNRGQVKIAGQNVPVNGLTTAAFSPIAANLTDTTTGALIEAATVSAAIANVNNTINNLKKVYIGPTTPTGTEEIGLYRDYRITQQPQNIIVNALGETANLTVETGDPNATYLGYIQGEPLIGYEAEGISGADTNILTVVTNSDNVQYDYECDITFETGVNTTTTLVNIIIYHIIQQPTNATIAQIGDNVTFRVKTGDPNATYQGERRASSSSDGTNSAATGNQSNTISFESTSTNQSGSWRCVVTFDDDTTETSDIVTYTVTS